MPVLKDSETKTIKVAPHISRKHIHLNNIITAIVDFTDGPQAEPDPAHSHPHEQISYIAKGEIYVFINGEKTHLKEGDMFAVAGGVPHCIQMLTREVRIIDSFTPIREDFLK
jgi:quercetin dioxygenase-like cupin family protein